MGLLRRRSALSVGPPPPVEGGPVEGIEKAEGAETVRLAIFPRQTECMSKPQGASVYHQLADWVGMTHTRPNGGTLESKSTKPGSTS